jgi:microcompartment protein CcmK/EutM
MQVGRVVGTLVATRKDERLVGAKLLVVRIMDPSFKEEQGYLVAVDTVNSGVGDRVLLVSGSSARLAQGMKDSPVDAAIVGVVDQVELSKIPSKG